MICLFLIQLSNSDLVQPIVIAHRGASGYAVEHTEASKGMAHAQGANYLEQDVVMSRDQQFIVSHDITMEETTDVESRYPDRARPDGRFYFADFDWTEIQQLQMHERTGRGSSDPALPNRFPGSGGQRVLRLTDEISLIQGWNQTTGKDTGLYIELKSPAFHKKEFGLSMGQELLSLLARHGIEGSESRCFIQCFEPDELVELFDRLHCQLPLVQLLGKQVSEEEVMRIARYAKGIGPSLELIAERDSNGTVKSTGLVEFARSARLFVHPYTVRKGVQPRWSKSMDETHKVILEQIKVDGFFTDYPDLGRQAVANAAKANR